MHFQTQKTYFHNHFQTKNKKRQHYTLLYSTALSYYV